MNKKTWVVVLTVSIVGLGVYALWGVSDKSGNQSNAPIVATLDPSNASYIIEGQRVSLVNGRSEVPAAPRSATMITTTLFDTSVAGDINGDGRPDVAVILVQDPGGSGTFYYVAADVTTDRGSEGSNAILLGDRIAPQNIAIQNTKIIVNYADRQPGEPMSVAPSVGTTKYFTYSGSALQASSRVVGQ